MYHLISGFHIDNKVALQPLFPPTVRIVPLAVALVLVVLYYPLGRSTTLAWEARSPSPQHLCGNLRRRQHPILHRHTRFTFSSIGTLNRSSNSSSNSHHVVNSSRNRRHNLHVKRLL
jgi:hypothetical protein